MPLSKDSREFVECLNSKRVDYLIVGALAVSWHGFSRFSADVDFFLRRTASNAERVIEALRLFGFGTLDITLDDLVTPGRIIQLGYEPNRIDLITSISGVDFDEAWADRVEGEMNGVPVTFIGRSALLRNKAATGRAKDLIDLEELRKQDPLR